MRRAFTTGQAGNATVLLAFSPGRQQALSTAAYTRLEVGPFTSLTGSDLNRVSCFVFSAWPTVESNGVRGLLMLLFSFPGHVQETMPDSRVKVRRPLLYREGRVRLALPPLRRLM